MDEQRQAPIRVLHVLTAMNRAGTETMLMNLYRVIDRERVQFDFAVTARKPCDYDKEILALGGRIIRYPRYTGKNHLAYKTWWKAFFPANPQYRIVHGHIGSTAAIYLKIAQQFGCYTIAHSHSTGGINAHDLAYRLFSFPTRYVADHFFGCSTEALVSRYGKAVAGDSAISQVLRNGIDIAQYRYNAERSRAVRAELGLAPGALVAGTVGRINAVKNVFFLIDILEALQRRVPDFRFLWIGTGELNEAVKTRIAEKHLEKNVLLLGLRDDVPRLLQAMNVFLLPSKYEGLPVVGVEVQAAGLPMLCSDRVSRELGMSDCVTFLPIDSVGPWVEAVCREQTFRRVPNAPAAVAAAGYDVRKTSAWLTEFYEAQDRSTDR